MLLDELGEKIGVVFDVNNRIDGQLAYDIAATSQKAFEECFLEAALPCMEKYKEYPLCITGGCGLNILLNTRLKEEFGREVFVGPVPNDVGLAVGMMCDLVRPDEQVDITYSGIPLLDEDSLGEYVSMLYPSVRKLSHERDAWDGHTEVTYDTLCNDLITGKIIGVVRGNSEHGARALGNRSILCNPAFSDMKNILNENVKHREWYRPFAPVVRLEDVSKYFEWVGESRWMTFCPKVKDEWKEKLSSIVHIDGTARVQTITREQNPWLYDLLTMMDSKTGVGVLLNTSFNVNGKPIVSTLKDAFYMYNTTKLDGLVVNDNYFRKEPFGIFV
jgi:predicted NodU family carbamoyl transferase